MKAVVYDRYGPASVLRLAEIDKPTPRPGELLIRVGASEVTKTDCELRSFHFGVKWFWLPLRLACGVFRPRKQVLGMYFAGEVELVGEACTRFAVGERVFGSAQFRLGGHGEYLCIPETYPLARVPEGLSWEEIATVPLGGCNGLHFMRLANIEPGSRVLIVGAGGSIGAHALQVAKIMGARVTVVDAAHKEAQLKRWGADDFVDYAQTNFWQAPERYDVVFNLVPSIGFSNCLRVLTPKGRYLMGNPKLSDMFATLLTKLLSRRTASFAFAAETAADLQTLADWMSAGKLTPCLDQLLPLEQAQAAHERVETEARVGCVVLQAQS